MADQNQEEKNALIRKYESLNKLIQDLVQVQEVIQLEINKENNNQVKNEMITLLENLRQTRLNIFSQLSSALANQNQINSQTSESNQAVSLSNNMLKTAIENAMGKINEIRKNKDTHLRLLQISNYEKERYASHKNIMKIITYTLAIILLFVFLMKSYLPYTDYIGTVGIIVTISIMLVLIFPRLRDNMNRSNVDWQKFSTNVDPYLKDDGTRTDDDGGGLNFKICPGGFIGS